MGFFKNQCEEESKWFRLILFYQIYLYFLEQTYYIPPKCWELSGCIDTAHTEVKELCSRCMNGSNACYQCVKTQDTHPFWTAYRMSPNHPRPTWVVSLYRDHTISNYFWNGFRLLASTLMRGGLRPQAYTVLR